MYSENIMFIQNYLLLIQKKYYNGCQYKNCMCEYTFSSADLSINQQSSHVFCSKKNFMRLCIMVLGFWWWIVHQTIHTIKDSNIHVAMIIYNTRGVSTMFQLTFYEINMKSDNLTHLSLCFPLSSSDFSDTKNIEKTHTVIITWSYSVVHFFEFACVVLCVNYWDEFLNSLKHLQCSLIKRIS